MKAIWGQSCFLIGTLKQ